MRRFAPLVVFATLPLVPMLLAGCDGGADDIAPTGTVAVGSLPGRLVTDTTVPETSPSTTTRRTRPTEPDEAATTDPTTPPTADPTTAPPTTEPPGTALAVDLAGLVPDPGAPPPPSSVVTDDTGRLQMVLPDAWGDRRTMPSTLADGTPSPSLSASADMTSFLDGYDEAGLTAVVVAAEPDAALDAYAFGEDCAGDGRTAYDNGRWAGEYEVWRDCGGTDADIVTVAIRQGRAPSTVLVLAQITEGADLAALDVALGSLRLTP
jgi:hypothetical protein